MAEMKIDGIDSLGLSLAEIAEIPDDVADRMVTAGAEIAKTAQKAFVRRMGLVDTGQLEKSIRVLTKKNGSDGFRSQAVVYPGGKRKNGVRNAEVGFIHHYGAPKRRIPATRWMDKANDSCADDVVAAELAVYDEFLKSKNL